MHIWYTDACMHACNVQEQHYLNLKIVFLNQGLINMDSSNTRVSMTTVVQQHQFQSISLAKLFVTALVIDNYVCHTCNYMIQEVSSQSDQLAWCRN